MAHQMDMAEALRQRDAGIEQAEQHSKTWTERARDLAVEFATRNGTVTADDVREVMYAADDRPEHYNAWGSVFLDKRLEFTGSFRRSRVVRGHGNLQRVWRLR